MSKYTLIVNGDYGVESRYSYKDRLSVVIAALRKAVQLECHPAKYLTIEKDGELLGFVHLRGGWRGVTFDWEEDKQNDQEREGNEAYLSLWK